MKKYISYLLTLALLVPAFVSCTREFQDDHSQNNTHLVYFYTSNPETRTGLTIDEGWVYPDWRETKEANLHFFEIPENGGDPTYGEALDIVESVDNTTARFVASFTEEMTIIADPSTRAGGSDMFYYGAVVAQMLDEDDFTFVIPAKQKPDAGTLKDPDADFLIGYSRKACDAYVDNSEVVDLYFDRVAALGRLSLSNFKGANEKVKSVTINSTAGLVGSAAYANIHFGDKNTVDFTRTEGPLTLTYDTGEDLTEGAFEAYFVVIPGEATITSIEVLTDQYKYTKTLEGGKTITFSNEKFKNINVDLENAVAEKVSSVWYKASVLEDGIDYIIVSQGKMLNNGADGLTGENAPTDNNGIITFDSTPAASVIWTAATLSGLEEFGHFTLSNGGKYLYRYSQESTQYMVIGDLPQEPTKHYVWDFDGTYLYHVSSASENRNFYCYYSNEWTTDYTKSNAKPVTIYTTRAPQELSFDKESVEYDFDAGGEFEEPTLSAAGGTIYGAVTYSSDNTDVATVDSESGAVTIVKAGTAIITATAAGNAEYQAATASYTIVANTAALPTWYKAEEVENNGIYMVVSNGNALNLDGTSISTVSNDEFSGASFQYDANDNLKWTATVSADGKFTLKSGSRYLSRNSSNIQTSSSSGASLSYDSENNYVTTKGSSSTYYIYYATGNSSGWKASTTKYTATLYTTKPPLAARDLQFSSDGVTIDYATSTDVNEPTLEGIKDGVTYTSSNTAVATVDPTSGEVVLTGTRGSVRIIASAPKTDSYKEESVSYSLIVKNSNITTSTKTYYKIGSVANLEPGAQYLLVFEGLAGDTDGDGNPKVFKPILATDGNTFTKSTDNALDVEITNGMISSNAFVDSHLTLETGYFFKANNANKYLYPKTPSSGGGIISAENSASTQLNITFSEGIAHIIAKNDTYYLVWSTSSHYFSSNTDVEGQYSTGICLYVLDDSGVISEKQERNLAFSATSVTCTYGETPTWPTLSGVTTGVQYTSSNTDVATIDASTGAVNIKAAGTTTIKAEAAEDDNYLAGSAQYTLTVNPASGETVTVQLKKATRITSGKQYVLVSNGKALVRNGEATSAADFNSSNLTVTLPNTSEPNLWWTLGTTTDSNNRGNIYQFTNGGYYFGVVMDKTNTPYTYHMGLSTTTSNVEGNSNLSMPNHNIDLEQGYVFYKGSSSSQYIYFDGSSWNNHQESNGTFVADYKTTLYVLDDGTADPTTTYYLASSIEAGKQYLIVSNGKALQNNGGTAAAINVTVSDGAIQFYDDDAATSLWTATADGEKFNFANNSQYLVRSSSNVSIGNKSNTPRNNQWTYNSGNQQLIVSGSSASYYLSYSTSVSKWSIGSSGNATLYTTDPGSNPGGGDDPEPQTQYTYTQITSVSDLTDGASYLIVSSDANSYNGKDHQTLFAGDEAGTAVAVSATSGTITGAYSNYEFVITKSGSDYVLNGPNGYVTGNSGNSYSRYIQVSSSQVTMSLTNATELSAATSGDGLVSNAFYFYYTKSNSKEVLYLNSDGKYKIGGSGRKYGVYLYKKVENP